jgi:hypothetical protein
MSMVVAILAPVMTEVLLTALSRLRPQGYDPLDQSQKDSASSNSGLDKNRERLTLPSRRSSPQGRATALMVCENAIAGARHAGPCLPPRANTGGAQLATLQEIRRCYSNSWK